MPGELEEGYRRAKQQIAQLEAEIVEFRESSRELETELELELEESENKHKQLQQSIHDLTHEVSTWKNKYLDLQKEFAASQASHAKQISALQEAHTRANTRLREIEMENDDMERHDRMTQATLADLESRYHESLEEIAMLESDLASRDSLKEELQRTKDELRDTREELTMTSSKLTSATAEVESLQSMKRTDTSSDTALKRSSKRDGQRHDNKENSHLDSVPESLQQPPYRSSLSSSKSLRKIHGMLDQMRSLESRVATFKSSLPRSGSTPNQSPVPRSSPRSPPSGGSPSTRIPVWSPKVSPEHDKSDKSPNSVPGMKRTTSTTKLSPLQSRRISTRHVPELTSPAPLPTNPTTPVFYKAPVRLGTIQGSPSEMVDTPSRSRPRQSSQRAASSSFPSKPNGRPSSRGEQGRTLSSSKPTNRPGSAFSILHSRPSMGHGRLV